MLPSLGPYELIIILVVGLVLFGKRIPQAARSLGQGLVELKRGLSVGAEE